MQRRYRGGRTGKEKGRDGGEGGGVWLKHTTGGYPKCSVKSSVSDRLAMMCETFSFDQDINFSSAK